MKKDLLQILACPRCKGGLRIAGDQEGLICDACRLIYPVRDGIPVLLVEEGTALNSDENA